MHQPRTGREIRVDAIKNIPRLGLAVRPRAVVHRGAEFQSHRAGIGAGGRIDLDRVPHLPAGSTEIVNRHVLRELVRHHALRPGGHTRQNRIRSIAQPRRRSAIGFPANLERRAEPLHRGRPIIHRHRRNHPRRRIRQRRAVEEQHIPAPGEQRRLPDRRATEQISIPVVTRDPRGPVRNTLPLEQKKSAVGQRQPAREIPALGCRKSRDLHGKRHAIVIIQRRPLGPENEGDQQPVGNPFPAGHHRDRRHRLCKLPELRQPDHHVPAPIRAAVNHAFVVAEKQHAALLRRTEKSRDRPRVPLVRVQRIHVHRNPRRLRIQITRRRIEDHQIPRRTLAPDHRPEQQIRRRGLTRPHRHQPQHAVRPGEHRALETINRPAGHRPARTGQKRFPLSHRGHPVFRSRHDQIVASRRSFGPSQGQRRDPPRPDPLHLQRRFHRHEPRGVRFVHGQHPQASGFFRTHDNAVGRGSRESRHRDRRDSRKNGNRPPCLVAVGRSKRHAHRAALLVGDHHIGMPVAIEIRRDREFIRRFLHERRGRQRRRKRQQRENTKRGEFFHGIVRELATGITSRGSLLTGSNRTSKYR